jgi:hypothetical protein
MDGMDPRSPSHESRVGVRAATGRLCVSSSDHWPTHVDDLPRDTPHVPPSHTQTRPTPSLALTQTPPLTLTHAHTS